MSLAPAPSDPTSPQALDRREYRRHVISLPGRYMLADQREFPCRTVALSPEFASLAVPVRGEIGERIIAYIERFGRIEGEITRLTDSGFAMSIAAAPELRDKLAATLAWLCDRGEARISEERRYHRVVPKNPFTSLTLADGTFIPCRLLNVSLSGAAVATDAEPAVGTPVRLGAIEATVVRHFEGGLGVDFAAVQTDEWLQALL